MYIACNPMYWACPQVRILGAKCPRSTGKMAAARNSLFERFSYRRTKEVMVLNEANAHQSKKDSRVEEDAILTNITPNKEHLTSVPETPDSLIRTSINTPLRYKNSMEKRKKRQRRRARISSSSEDDGAVLMLQPLASDLATTQEGFHEDLFCGCPVSKRSKQEVGTKENKPFNILRKKDCDTEVDGCDEDKPLLCHRPRKLSYERGGVTTEDRDGKDAEEELVLSHRKQKARRRPTDQSEGSSEDLPMVRLTDSSGKDVYVYESGQIHAVECGVNSGSSISSSQVVNRISYRWGGEGEDRRGEVLEEVEGTGKVWRRERVGEVWKEGGKLVSPSLVKILCTKPC